MGMVTRGDTINDIMEAVIASDMIEFANIRGFAKSPEEIISDRAKWKLERIDNSLKIEMYGGIADDDIVLDVNNSDDLDVSPGVELESESYPNLNEEQKELEEKKEEEQEELEEIKE